MPPRAAPLAGVLLAAPLLAGCSAAPGTYEPTGVDLLSVPTADPDPDDFVDPADPSADLDANAFLPLDDGHAWTYRVATPGEQGRSRSRRVVVEADGARVDGVPTLALRSTGAGPTVVDRLALDRAGNVWWFAREGEWAAGVDGAEAGLLVPARPRLGDGFVQYALEAGDVALGARATVVSVDPPAGQGPAAPGRTLTLAETSSLRPGTTQVAVYEAGVGLVSRSGTDGAALVLDQD